MKPTKFEIQGFEMLEKIASNDARSSSSVYVPKSWAGKKVIIVRVEK
ncbi:MAG TPA: DUF2080 family transposase-associated protein [Candidatus Paceibacterota bacterium]|nr:DUF2080 family transposase-associated protein [Candidatus Paceibacterota bacterium]